MTDDYTVFHFCAFNYLLFIMLHWAVNGGSFKQDDFTFIFNLPWKSLISSGSALLTNLEKQEVPIKMNFHIGQQPHHFSHPSFCPGYHLAIRQIPKSNLNFPICLSTAILPILSYETLETVYDDHPQSAFLQAFAQQPGSMHSIVPSTKRTYHCTLHSIESFLCP